MNNNLSWVPENTTLSGHTVRLEPMKTQHLQPLSELARDKRIWEFFAFDGSDPRIFSEKMNTALENMARGDEFLFVICDQKSGQLLGATRYLDIQAKHRKLEIGGTWLHPDHWATNINPECKLLLLTHAFETLGALRVQFKTDENNKRSRRAIEKIGGKFEGILRNEMIRSNGSSRNSVFFSIISDEWPEAKEKLSATLQKINTLAMNHILIESERLYLRPLSIADAENMYRLNLDPRVIEHTGDLPFNDVEHARLFLEDYCRVYKQYGTGRWAVINKSSEEFLGWCGIKYDADKSAYDIGFRFFADHWNMGYATEAARACLKYGFTILEIPEIIGRARTANTASVRVLEKSGMHLAGSFDFEEHEGLLYKISANSFLNR